MLKQALAFAALSFSISAANAAFIVGDLYTDTDGIQWEHVGSFDLADGPKFASVADITPYNGIEAAILNFGVLSAGEVYALSTGSTTVNHRAWYNAFDSSVSVHERGESATANNAGSPYYDASGDISAFISHRETPGNNINYVFITPAVPSPVPLPAAVWLFGSALLGLGAMKRKRA